MLERPSSASTQTDQTILLQPSNSRPSRVLSQEDLSPEETYVLFAVLQQAANELRKMKHAKYPEA
jgi:hypothetical protein